MTITPYEKAAMIGFCRGCIVTKFHNGALITYVTDNGYQLISMITGIPEGEVKRIYQDHITKPAWR